MTYLSIIEKLRILFNSLLDFEFILIFTILLLIFTFLYIIKIINGKKYMLFMFVSFVIVFCISIVNNYKVLSNTFDNFATIFFGNIYFPSIYVYIGVLVISFIAFMTSLLNVMIKRIYKIINSIMFVVNNILFIIILNVIAKNNIDIFLINSLYTNTSLVVILELSMGLFIIWVLSLTAVYVTNSICERIAVKRIQKVEKQEEIFNPVLEVSNDLVNDVNILNDLDEVNATYARETSDIETDLVVEQIQDANENNVMAIQNNVNENVVLEEIVSSDEEVIMEEFSDINNDVVLEENTISYENDNRNSITFNDILNGCIPVTYYDNSVINEEYSLIDPQMIYEDNYNKAKSESILFNNVEVTLDDVSEDIFNNTDIVLNDNNLKESIIENNKFEQEEVQLSVEELTLKEKEKVSEERLVLNTISLNDLIDDDIVSEVEINTDNNNVLEIKEEKEKYTTDDYKKIIKMLNDLKNYSNTSNINIDDALAISLIGNYSIDDCVKFKNILENNLN